MHNVGTVATNLRLRCLQEASDAGQGSREVRHDVLTGQLAPCLQCLLVAQIAAMACQMDVEYSMSPGPFPNPTIKME